jgi:hypothetical protein
VKIFQKELSRTKERAGDDDDEDAGLTGPCS